MRTPKKPNREGLFIKKDVHDVKSENSIVLIHKTSEGSRKQTLTREKASHIINRYSIAAAAIGAIPFPGTDIVAVSALQADLVEELANEYGLKISPDWGKHIAVILAGSMGVALGARTAFSALKALPVVGSALGGGSSAIASAATTYTIGRMLMDHFEKGGTLNKTVIQKLANSTTQQDGGEKI